ncbi:Calx-beta domain-containing protein [Nioella nitratireducens]|uniref:Calx-beta domain-containing protein n=1 Tax=Nioella nitratireducens TaxID=1287720 RepID=UPI0008FD36BE|nr:Calx-beta domain-containing protein [Nioella nitratireducens]
MSGMINWLKAIFLLIPFLCGTAANASGTCSGRAELWFLNDESGSVTDTEFASAQSFLASVASSFDFATAGGFRGSLVAWDQTPTLISGLTTTFPTVASTYSRSGSGSTYPGAAMAYAAGAITGYSGSAYATDGGAAARTGVPSIVVLMTDADGTNSQRGGVQDETVLLTAANNLRAAGSEVVIMLIAEAADRYDSSNGNYEADFETMMNTAAGSSTNVIVGATYADIANPANGYISNLSNRICDVAATLFPAGISFPTTAGTSSQDLTASEAGDSATLLVVLDAAPTADVAVTFANDAQCGFSPDPMTFTAANWDTAQAVTVTATDDSAIEGEHSCTPVMTIASSDTNYNGLTPSEPTVTITDNDFAQPALSISHSLQDLTREFTGVYMVSFRTTLQNTGNVALTNIVLDNSFADFVGASNIVSVVSTAVVEGPSGVMVDSSYNGNDSAGLLPSSVTLDVSSRLVVTGTVRFRTPSGFPSGLNVATANAKELAVPVSDDAGLGVTDTDNDGGVDSLESDTADRDGDGIVDSQDYDPTGYFYCEDDGHILTGGAVSVTDAAGSSENVTIVQNGAGGYYQWYAAAAGTYTMAITYPTDVGIPSTSRLVETSALDVTSLLPNDPAFLGSTEFGSSGALADYSLSANPRFYRVFEIAAGDPNVMANNIPMTRCATNTASISGGADGAESNSATPFDGSFTVSLVRQATADTLITYTIGGTATAGTDYVSLSGNVTIPSGDTTADIPVAVLEDGLIESPETVAITLTGLSGGDSRTSLATDGSQTRQIQISSDDGAGIDVTNVDLTASEAGDTATMRFALTAVPSAPVTLTFTGDAQCTVSPQTMVFTAATWNVSQDLTISAISDGVVEGSHVCHPTVTVASADSDFAALTPTLGEVTVSDGLIDQVRDQLTTYLERDLEATVSDQARGIRGFASGAGDRLRAEPVDLGYCNGPDTLEPTGSISYHNGTLSADVSVTDDYVDCVRDERVIVETGMRIRSVDGIADVLSFSGSYLREYRDDNQSIQGRFLSAYLNTPSGGANGDRLRGMGLSFGVYGANRFQGELIIEHYLGLGVGYHDFRLSFGRDTPILVEGGYRYAAFYGGIALSGAVGNDEHPLALRGGVDLAYALPDDARVDARQGDAFEHGSLTLHDLGAFRLFSEADVSIRAGDVPNAASERTVILSPGLFCSLLTAQEQRANCGVSLGLDIQVRSIDGSREFGLELDGEVTRSTASAGIRLRRTWFFDDRAGQSEVGLGVTATQSPRLDYALNWSF